MDTDLLMIMVMIVTVAAIIGISANSIVGKVLDYKRSKDSATTQIADTRRDAGMIADRTEMIEDRLRVLERLATDRGVMLADEIKALRESKPVSSNGKQLEGNHR